MCNRDNTCDIHTCLGEKVTKKKEPTNQAKNKINITKGLKTYLKDFKKLSHHLPRL